MKQCPKCSSQYSDQTLSFCLQDGTPLVGGVRQSNVDTVAFNNPVTAEKIFPTQNFVDVVPDRPKTEVLYQPYLPKPMMRPKRSNKKLIAGMAVLSGIVVLGLGLAGWMYVSTQKPALARMLDDHTQPSTSSPLTQPDQPVDVVTPANTKTVNPSPVPIGKVDPDAIRKQITGIVDSWKGAAETCNIADYAAKYGEKSEYHDRHGVTPQEVGNDLQKICDGHSSVSINIDNMVVAVDAEGDAATAIFDKEWKYEASPKLAQGKAHMKLYFRKIADGWKIVSEQTLKTYYSRS